MQIILLFAVSGVKSTPRDLVACRNTFKSSNVK